jgi:crossover junction endodeoxyribonuclease RuvC
LNTTGYAVIEFASGGVRLIEAGVILARANQSLPKRLQELHEGLFDVIQSTKPSWMAIEQLFSHYERPRTAILMGHARGVLCLAAALNGLEVIDFEPTRVKKVLTGNGRAGKPQVQLAVQRELSLATLPEPADVADAMAIALCGYYLTTSPLASGHHVRSTDAKLAEH